MVDAQILAVNRRDLRVAAIRRKEMSVQGGAVLRVDHFALTANNVTYAAFGDEMHYWDFFPLDDAWGVVPVWGFATVVESAVAGINEGERFYGYYPSGSHLHVVPGQINEKAFVDEAPHRTSLTAGYNLYAKTSADPFYSTASEEAQMLLRPLFITAFVIDDYFGDNDFFGARTVLLSSASSKTAAAAAYCLSRREGIEVIGLTSPANVAYVRSLGSFDQVLTYDQLDTLSGEASIAYIDMAANGALRRRIHEKFAALKMSCAVGATHWDQMVGQQRLPGPRPERLFVPRQVSKRLAEWGPRKFRSNLLDCWSGFIETALSPSRPWLRVVRNHGETDLTAAWRQLVEGRSDPRFGRIFSLGE